VKSIRESGGKVGDRVRTPHGIGEILWFKPGGLTPRHVCVVLESNRKQVLVTVDSCIRVRKKPNAKHSLKP
jgi:hypothetical protein